MREIRGKTVLTELSELVDPAHTALVLIDMQHDFVDANGVFGLLGIDLTMYKVIVPPLLELLTKARENGVLIIHVQNTALPDGVSDSGAQIRFNLRMHQQARKDDMPLQYTVPGTIGHEFIPELVPLADELVVRKYRSSAFWGTNLELLLQSNGVETVVIGGCTTEGCVESTARDAMFNNHYVVVATDCVGSDDRALHDASMLLMRNRFDLGTAAEIGEIWENDAMTT